MFDDGFEASHPIFTPVEDPSQISSLFDSITYSKGASVLTMLEATVTAANFRDGLRVIAKKLYLQRA
jgi:aminopeptidase N